MLLNDVNGCFLHAHVFNTVAPTKRSQHCCLHLRTKEKLNGVESGSIQGPYSETRHFLKSFVQLTYDV